MSHIEARKQQALDGMQVIMRLLNWNEQQYCDYLYDCGVEYLRYLMPDDADGITNMERSGIFWKWWKNHWASRDAAFIEWFQCSEDLEDLYYNANDARTLAAAIYPTGVIMKESCREIINSLFNPKTLAV